MATSEIDGKKADLAAYNTGGNNFFKPRGGGTSLNFDADYDGATSTMTVKSRRLKERPNTNN